MQLYTSRAVKEAQCETSLNRLSSDDTESWPAKTSYSLPDGSEITLNEERFSIPELFFDPSALRRSDVSVSIPNIIHETIRACATELRRYAPSLSLCLCLSSLIWSLWMFLLLQRFVSEYSPRWRCFSFQQISREITKRAHTLRSRCTCGYPSQSVFPVVMWHLFLTRTPLASLHPPISMESPPH